MDFFRIFVYKNNYFIMENFVIVFAVIVISVIVGLIVLNFETPFASKDRKIAFGILRNMDSKPISNIRSNGDYDFTFDLDGFTIHIQDLNLYVDDIRIYCNCWEARGICDKAYSIFNNDTIEKERMIRKDALIHFASKDKDKK